MKLSFSSISTKAGAEEIGKYWNFQVYDSLELQDEIFQFKSIELRIIILSQLLLHVSEIAKSFIELMLLLILLEFGPFDKSTFKHRLRVITHQQDNKDSDNIIQTTNVTKCVNQTLSLSWVEILCSW